ncbi:hypothetical protein PIB30_001908 [Stylosanthes scabra]|uniref:Uncharacterized protein n=1 Tax=Stylosanthes scabra TaxID=79078 RepID=A0ABU6X0H2_9FABA|nr:hypothetical protein [Stylosanthes scabra]
MAEGTRLARLEEMTLSNKHEIATLTRGMAEANERVAENKLQLDSIEKLLRDHFARKTKTEEEIPFHETGSGHTHSMYADSNRPWKLKVADLPMCDGDGIEDWVFRARQYLETFNIPEGQRI